MKWHSAMQCSEGGEHILTEYVVHSHFIYLIELGFGRTLS
jgi:hypothetical protein